MPSLKAQDGAGFDADARHIAFHTTLPGRVDIWPIVEKNDKAEIRLGMSPSIFSHQMILSRCSQQGSPAISGI
jgi:hypothetical protein